MVMKMSSLDKLKEVTNYSEEECVIIKNILENHRIIGRKNKEKIITDFIQELRIDEKKADELYNICMELKLKEIL